MIDDKLIKECQKLTGIQTRRALIDYALHEVRRRGRQKQLLKVKSEAPPAERVASGSPLKGGTCLPSLPRTSNLVPPP